MTNIRRVKHDWLIDVVVEVPACPVSQSVRNAIVGQKVQWLICPYHLP